MLPHVEHQKRGRCSRDISLLVIELFNDELAADGVPGQEGPTRALKPESGGVEVCTELIERSEELVDGGSELAGGAFL